MAAYNFKSAVLRLVYDDGLTIDGKPKRKVKTYSGMLESATADQMVQAADAFSSLSSKALIGAEKQQISDIY
ncbi:DUF1659 domain-containing protein [Chryseomicrobium palamuruense]|uniref:DUF1659 domain-containing protein n=1 Tax=Chryseomicrobium palamuruense TaxID=682973 RepID=A0ABV8UXZ1_9BACL